MTIALYVRVSTDEQAQHGYGIDGQMHRLEAFCESQGWTDYQFYIDDGYTGTNLNRPQLKRLLRHIEQGKIEKVAVYRLDRISRRQKDVLYLLEDVFLPRKISFVSTTESFDSETPFGKALIGILSVFAQLERDTIVERTQQGRTQRIRKGLWGGGVGAFGYAWNKDTQRLEVVPNEATLVKEVYRQFERGKSLMKIAEWLDKRVSNRNVNHSFVKEMLMRPTYAGLLRDGDNFVQGNHDAIIDESDWRDVQVKLQERIDGRRPYGKYLLSNIGICGACGSPLKHQVSSRKLDRAGRWAYYMCSKRHKSGKQACPESRYYNTNEIDQLISERIKKLEFDVPDIMELVNANEEELPNADTIAYLQKRLQEISERLDNLFEAVASGIRSKNLTDMVRELEGERSSLELQLDELTAQQESESSPEEILDNLRIMAISWEEFTYEERCAALRKAVEKVIVYPDKTLEFVWNTL